MSSEKPYSIRVKVLDGKPREWNKLKGQLGSHLDVIDAKDKIEFVIRAVKEAHLEQVRAKLSAAGLEEIPDGDTASVSRPAPKPAKTQGNQHRNQQRPQARHGATPASAPDLRKKPYGFVPLPDELTAASPVWHDGTEANDRLSGEIRCELVTLTPLLVGWERQRIDDVDEPWAVPHNRTSEDDLDTFVQDASREVYPDADDKDEEKRQRKQRKIDRDRSDYVGRVRSSVVEMADIGRTIRTKSVLCPLRAPWGARPVLLPGDSLKGLLRHELGALLGAPMERVAERSYSYRPNSLFPKDPNPRLVPRLARIPDNAVEMRPLDPNEAESPRVRVPTRLDLLPQNLRYDKDGTLSPPRYRFDVPNAAAYRGGQGAGEKLNSKRDLHETLEASPDSPTTPVLVSEVAQNGYLQTLRHLTDLKHGHFSERHPDIPTTVTGEDARGRILEAASNVVFQPGDLIWVEWDTRAECIVSLGWHYYYRWAYTDTVRRKGGGHERHGLFPLPEEKNFDEAGAPRGLSAVRRLFGYTGDNEGSKSIGQGDHEQLMGRLSVNAAIEVVPNGSSETERFLPATFLKELGRPRPSAVEHYLQQPHWPNSRPSDKAKLTTYGDAAADYDTPGELAGRKFYLDRPDAYTGTPWADDSPKNRLNERSTLALEASKPDRRFRFTLRFRDLDTKELIALLLAFCPNQFSQNVGGSHVDGYCSKLGYARPLGWGSVRIEAKELHFLDTEQDVPTLTPEDVSLWFRRHRSHLQAARLREWLDVHRCKCPDAEDYPRENGEVFTFHTKLRAEHSRDRRYKREDR